MEIFFLVVSPILKHTILVLDLITGKKVTMFQNIQFEFIRELHNDLIKSKDEGGLGEVWKEQILLVSDIGLRFIIPTCI